MKLNKLTLPTVVLLVGVLTGCASSQKVEVVQPGDNKLSCAELAEQRDELDGIKASNDKNKGFTGTNVAAALFFWPALAYTYIDAKDAEKVISERKSHLTGLMNQKGC